MYADERPESREEGRESVFFERQKEL